MRGIALSFISRRHSGVLGYMRRYDGNLLLQTRGSEVRALRKGGSWFVESC